MNNNKELVSKILEDVFADTLKELFADTKNKKQIAASAKHTRINHQKGGVKLPSSRIDRRKNPSYRSGRVITYNLKDLTEAQAEQLGLLKYWKEVVKAC